MQSSHAMSLGFIGTFAAIGLAWTRMPMLLCIPISSLHRAQTNLHTKEQILVGLVIGSINGATWRLSLTTGSNYLGINVLDWVSNTFLNENGQLPLCQLGIIALLGVAIVGSVERQISAFIKQMKETKTE